MSADLIPFDKAKVPAALANVLGEDANDDLSSGVSGGFSVISFRGSKWRVKHSGDETLLRDAEGEVLPSIRVLILKANRHISKNFYADGFVEGSADAPDCFSMDGVKPDPSVENPVNPQCADCPKNQFGSRITDTGSKAKACSDNRRIAVVPEGDYANEQFGGPMLLRVPAASLSELAKFGKAMKGKGFPYNTIITRVSFDPDTAYPKLNFNAVRPLNDDEAAEVVGYLQDDEYRQKLDFILAEAVEVAVDAAEPKAKAEPKADPTEFEEPPAEKPKAKAKAKPKAKPEPEPDPEPEEDVVVADTTGDDELDELLGKLDSLE